MWSHDVVATSIGFSSDLKMGQYLKVRLGFTKSYKETNKGVMKIPPRALFVAQMWGTIIGEP